jgi:protein-disulfide isomerase
LPLKELVKEYDGKVRVVFKHLVVHPQVMNAHIASCAAGKLGKFNEFSHEFWEKGFKARKMDDANIEVIAKGIPGLDFNKWKALRDGEECKQLVQNDMAELSKFRVNSTPTFFVNGTHVGGALPKEAFKQMIDEKLQTATTPDHYERVIMATGEKQFRSKMDSKP